MSPQQESTAHQVTFFGAWLCEFKKKDGGIRPIAVGNTPRRLVARAALKSVSNEVDSLLRPKQLDFSILTKL